MQLYVFFSMQVANFIIITTSKWVKYLSPHKPATRMREPSVRQPFHSMTSNRMTSVLLILQFSSDTLTRRNAKPGKSGPVALDLAPGSIRTPMPGPAPSKICHRLLLLPKTVRLLWLSVAGMKGETGKMFALFVPASIPTQSKTS